MHIDPRALVVLAWSLVVLMSWVGLGATAARWVMPRRRVGLGLCAAWGMAIFALIGGPLNALQICSKRLVIGLVVAGAILALPTLAWQLRRAWRRPGRTIRAALPALPLVAWGAIVLIGSMSWQGNNSINMIDDLPLYMVMPQRMLQAGAAIDPLNMRRLSTFGGYAFLQTPIAAVGSPFNGYVVDEGLASIVLVMMLTSLTGRRGWSRWTWPLIGFVVWFYPLPRQNMMADWVTTVALLAMLLTVRLADRRPARRLRLLAMAAATATAACTFRDNTLALPPVFFTLYFADRIWRQKSSWRAAAGEMSVVVATGLLTLLPWSIALFQAGGSFLYPLMPGNQRDPYFAFVPPAMTASTRLSVVWRTVVDSAFLLAYVPTIFVFVRKDRPAICLFAAAISMSAATTYAFATADPPWLERFCLPAILVAGFYGLAMTMRPPPEPRGPWLGAFAAVMALVLVLFPTSYSLGDVLNKQRIGVQSALAADWEYCSPQTRQAYADLQHAAPPGTTIALVLTYPTLLDFGRNTIDCIDTPGAATKVGLWPFRQGPDALRRYLADQGIDYVAFYDFNKSIGIYYAKWWQPQLLKGDRTAPRMLDMMETLDALAREQTPTYDRDGYRLIRIR